MSADYPSRLRTIRDHFERNIYPAINSGAIIASLIKKKDPIYLNDHGIDHVLQVIERISDLIVESKWRVNPYQAYIILSAAFYHDIGNIYGREKHEQKCAEIMRQIGTLAGEDDTEKRIICRIAAAHGGDINGDKDTIGKLDPSFTLFSIPVDKQGMASILRFADELADDKRRASRFFLRNRKLIKYSEIYHSYSNALRSVEIRQREIKLHFELSRQIAKRLFLKDNKKRYLVDEIYSRSLKMHTEAMYCMRFLRPNLHIDKIVVSIEFFDDKFAKRIHPTINYTLQEHGYPRLLSNNIEHMVPELKKNTGYKISKRI
jgi:hypothetical protein